MVRGVVTVTASLLSVVALTACSTVPTPTTSDGPRPTSGRIDPSWVPAITPGPVPGSNPTAPTDPAALAQAKTWIVAATPPPGVHALEAAPSGAPARPATLVACDWLVRATKWWSTDSSNVDAVKAWLTAHPVTGLVADGSMTGPGRLSALTEHSTKKLDDSIGFEFAPLSGGRVAIRVDVVIVPGGAGCISGGGAAAVSP
jgi:hypothetical protein